MSTTTSTLASFLEANANLLTEADAMVIGSYLSDVALNVTKRKEFFTLSEFLSVYKIDFEGMRRRESAFFVSQFQTILGEPPEEEDSVAEFLAEVKHVIRVLMAL